MERAYGAFTRDLHFNPRLHEGGDVIIHILHDRRQEFQSTPPRGRRRNSLTRQKTLIYFNPRLREGGDIPCDIPCDISTISIHASVREATIFPVCVALHHWYFNPRLREGGDCINYQFLHLIQSIPCIDHPSGTSN